MVAVSEIFVPVEIFMKAAPLPTSNTDLNFWFFVPLTGRRSLSVAMVWIGRKSLILSQMRRSLFKPDSGEAFFYGNRDTTGDKLGVTSFAVGQV